MELRPAVQKFAERMETVLRDNDHKAGWDDMDPWSLVGRIRDEADELFLALHKPTKYPFKLDEVWCKALEDEATKVASICLLLSDNLTRPRP